MTYSEAHRLAESQGITGVVNKHPGQWAVGKEFGGKFGERKRIVAILGPVTGRPSKGDRNYKWMVEEKC